MYISRPPTSFVSWKRSGVIRDPRFVSISFRGGAIGLLLSARGSVDPSDGLIVQRAGGFRHNAFIELRPVLATEHDCIHALHRQRVTVGESGGTGAQFGSQGAEWCRLLVIRHHAVTRWKVAVDGVGQGAPLYRPNAKHARTRGGAPIISTTAPSG